MSEAVARHIGGQDAPRRLEAPLGYRVVLECKTARGGKVTDPDAGRAAASALVRETEIRRCSGDALRRFGLVEPGEPATTCTGFAW